MDLKELKEKRAQLERDLFAATQRLIDDFQDKTKLKINRVDISLYDVDAIGAPSKSIVGDVKVNIDI